MIRHKQDAARKNSSRREGVLHCFRLYVTGSSPHSVRAIENTKRMCETYLKGRYDLEVIDLYQQPELARGEQLVAVPTLVKYHPLPQQRFVGDMTRTEQMLMQMNISFES